MKNKRIVVIDNDPAILEIMEFLLTDEGYQVIPSRKAGKIAKYINADLIIMDDWIEDAKGRDVCKKLKTNPRTYTIPVILFSTLINLAQVAAGCKADDFIAKPFDLEELIHMVKKHLK